jgi:Carboxypeptidase regulatory-like domain
MNPANPARMTSLLSESRPMRMKQLLTGPAWRAAVIPLLLTTSVNTAQQMTLPPISPGTSAIRGHVIDAITKQGVPGCTVRAFTGPEFRSATLETNDQGGYELTNIAAGSYSLFLTCPRHHSSACESADSGPNRCSSVNLVADQQRSNVNFRVTPGATARGRVVGADGVPIARAAVRLGAPLRNTDASFMVKPAFTDANGVFELVNLPAGEWRLEVDVPRPRGGLRPPIVYYPGGLTWDEAVGIELAAGKVTGNLTVVVPKIIEKTLTVRMAPDKAITRLAVSVLRAAPLTVLRLNLDRDGVATIKGMLPGRYVVAARGSSKRHQWAAFEVVDFAGDSVDVSLKLLPTGSIAGKVVAERGTLPPLDSVSVGASWVHDGAAVTPLDPDRIAVARNGSFRISDLFGTRKLQLSGLDPQWAIRAIRQKRRDVTTSGVEIVPGRTIETTIVVARQ